MVLSKLKWKIFSCAAALSICVAAAPVVPANADAYEGIAVDGNFTDWDTVSKVDANIEGLEQVAFVFDGDNIYIYMEASLNWTAGWFGSHGNGKCTIKTDLGNELLFQIVDASSPENVSIAGVDGATIAASDLTWGKDSYFYEICIPASALPPYNETISFGPYLAEDMFVEDVANINSSTSAGSSQGGNSGSQTGNSGSQSGSGNQWVAAGSNFDGITYDGSYDDWNYYPHTTIEYATPGTHETVIDGGAALYSDGGKLYGHVNSVMPAHREEAGGEFTSAVTIRINNSESLDFYPQFIAVDADGNINYNPDLNNLGTGTYEFYLIDSQGWKTATNTADWTDESKEWICGTNAVYGRAYVTVGASADNMEFEMDIPALADKFGMDANEIQSLAGQFGRIGQQWVYTAGTSTSPALGVGICVSVVGAVLFRQYIMKKREEQDELGAAAE